MLQRVKNESIIDKSETKLVTQRESNRRLHLKITLCFILNNDGT